MSVAISRDSTSFLDFGSVLSWSHTVGANATCLVVYVRDDTAATTGVTFNGVAMTQRNNNLLSGVYQYSMWQLDNPAVGTHTIAVTTSGSNISGAAASYNGVKGYDNAVNSANGAGVSQTAMTTAHNNCWMVLGVADRSGVAPTPGTNSTTIATPGAGASMRLFDSNGRVDLGTFQMDASGAGVICGVGLTLAPITTIDIDASSKGTDVTSSGQSWSHTCSGANRILFVAVHQVDAADATLTGVTYNGVAMTKLSSIRRSDLVCWTSLWYLLAPATGAHNVQVSLSSSVRHIGTAASYTGASQVAPTLFNAQNTNAPEVCSVTTIVANSWGVIAGQSSTPSAGTAVLQRQVESSFGSFIGDSSGDKTSPGTFTLTMNGSSSSTAIMAAFAPASLTFTAGLMFHCFPNF